MLARPRRPGDRIIIIIRRPDAIDGDGMNSLPAARRLRAPAAGQAADAGLVDGIRTVFFALFHGPHPPGAGAGSRPPAREAPHPLPQAAGPARRPCLPGGPAP